MVAIRRCIPTEARIKSVRLLQVRAAKPWAQGLAKVVLSECDKAILQRKIHASNCPIHNRRNVDDGFECFLCVQ